MEIKKLKQTNRGFYIYGEITDINEQKLRVQESSLATDIACWIFIDPSENYPDHTPYKIHLGAKLYPSIQINIKMAKKLIKALETFINQNRFSEKRMKVLK